MIKRRFGNCLVASKNLASQVSIPNSFTTVTYSPDFEEDMNIDHDIIRDYYAYHASITVVLRNLFTKGKNPYNNEYDYEKLNALSVILSDALTNNEEVYVKPYNNPDSVQQEITQNDIDEGVAFIVTIEDDINVINYVNYLAEAGQIVNLSFRTLSLIPLPVRTIGYGMGGYGAGGYGHV